MSPKRVVPMALIVALCCAIIPAPSLATSTTTEVEMGKEYDKQIVATQNLVTDPLLTGWVNGIGETLWGQTARKDVPYSVKILDVPDINAFSTLGGFIYVNSGLLDFAQSDDELAGVIGHETGHIERRHTLQNQNKASILGVLLSVGSMFSPFLYRFGQVIGAGVMAKIEREDEYQADKYGLMLMSRAGDDPNAMVSFMSHLGAVENAHNTLIDKYLQNHPDVPKRVAALVGYPELDPKIVTPQQRLAAAIHDEDEARYAIAAREFGAILAHDPANATAAYYLGETQIALGEVAQGTQNLELAVANGQPETKALAQTRMAALRSGEPRIDLFNVDLQPLRDQVAAADAAQTDAAAAVEARRNAARDQVKALQSREDTITYGMPNISGATAKPGSRLETVIANIALMDKSLDTVNAKTTQAINGIGSSAHNKGGGLLKDDAAVLAEMRAQLDAAPPTSPVLSELPAYPRMLRGLQAADADMVRALDASRASLALLDVALGDLDAFVRQLQRTSFNRIGDVDQMDYTALEPVMDRAVTSLGRAAVAAAQDSQLYNMARARVLEVRLDELGLASSPSRYATLQRALDVRFKNAAIDYATMLREDLSPAEVVAASIIAADTGATPQQIVDEAKTTHRSMVDVANARGMPALSLEIFLHLIDLDYTDDPDQEAHDVA